MADEQEQMSPEERIARARVHLHNFTLEDWQAHSDLLRERTKQLETWTPTHDDWHSPAQWAGLLTERVAVIAAAEDYIGPLSLVHDTRRDAARDAAIQLGALCWAIIASCHRGEQYRITNESPQGPDPNLLTCYEMQFEIEDGQEPRYSDSFMVVTSNLDAAKAYAMQHIAPTREYHQAIIGIWVVEGREVHGAHPTLPQPVDQTTSRLLEAARLAGLNLPTGEGEQE
ncbi:MAG: hypothetical protein E6Q97_02470 [Desulfurellales bacterium]|nr:MAG: hypothetical protein E6Q97_02470 [Desulfurellales bacterium]